MTTISGIPLSNCTNCGAVLPGDAQICPVCGAPVVFVGTSIQADQNTTWLNRRNFIRLLGFSSAAILVLAVILFLALKIMLSAIPPPFSATTLSAVTPAVASITGLPSMAITMNTGSTDTPQSFSTVIPTQTQQVTIPFQTQPATQISPLSWQQGLLVYLVRLSSGYKSIYALDLENGSPPQLLLQPSTNQQYYGPWLSPDSRKVVFYDLNGSNGLLDLQSRSLVLFEACNSPTFSPDGTGIICGSRGHFRILDAANGDFIRSLEVGVNGWLPVFSPDGSEVVFAVFGEGNATSIWRVDANGGNPVSLASSAFENYCPVWSPDGNWIAYQAGAGNKFSEIWIMDRNGGNNRQITTTPGGWSRGPVWSPDGKWLAFISTRSSSLNDEYGEVFVISLDTGEIHQVTHTSGSVDNWRLTWGSNQ